MAKYKILTEMNVLDDEGHPNMYDYLNINHHEDLPFLVEVCVDGFLGPSDIRSAIQELQDALSIIEPEWNKLSQEKQHEHSTQ